MRKSEPGTLRAGVGRTDITPPAGCFLEGFAGRDHGAEGIHDPLKATAVAISDGSRQAVVVSLDIADIPDSLVETIWEKVETHYHIAPKNLLINASHTHAGPITRSHVPRKDILSAKHAEPDKRYTRTLVEKIVTAVGKALGDIRPARVRWGCGETRIGMSRRARDVSLYHGSASGYLGIFANYPNPDKEIDRTCPVIFFTDTGDRPLALLFGASCHPTTMSHDNYHISAEYPGAARRILEQRLGAPALFLQGTGGDVKPRRVAEEMSFRSGTFEDVEAVGAELAEDVMAIIRNGLEPLEVRLRSTLRRIPVPLAPGWDQSVYERYLAPDQPSYRQTWAELWLERIRAGEPVPKSIDVTLSILELSPALRLLGIAGEPLTDMGRRLREVFPKGTTIPLGYSNGRTSYIPDETVFREGGYEALESIFFSASMPAPWREDIGEIIVTAFRELGKTLEQE